MYKGGNFKFGMATVLGKLYKTFDFEAAMLDIQVTEVTKDICCFQNFEYSIEPRLLDQI